MVTSGYGYLWVVLVVYDLLGVVLTKKTEKQK